MAELLPCPFCGSTYIRVGDSDELHNKSIKFNEPICFVECMSCRTVAGLYKKNFRYKPDYDAKEEAIKAWNTRTPKERGGEK